MFYGHYGETDETTETSSPADGRKHYHMFLGGCADVSQRQWKQTEASHQTEDARSNRPSSCSIAYRRYLVSVNAEDPCARRFDNRHLMAMAPMSPIRLNLVRALLSMRDAKRQTLQFNRAFSGCALNEEEDAS